MTQGEADCLLTRIVSYNTPHAFCTSMGRNMSPHQQVAIGCICHFTHHCSNSLNSQSECVFLTDRDCHPSSMTSVLLALVRMGLGEIGIHATVYTARARPPDSHLTPSICVTTFRCPLKNSTASMFHMLGGRVSPCSDSVNCYNID